MHAVAISLRNYSRPEKSPPSVSTRNAGRSREKVSIFHATIAHAPIRRDPRIITREESRATLLQTHSPSSFVSLTSCCFFLFFFLLPVVSFISCITELRDAVCVNYSIIKIQTVITRLRTFVQFYIFTRKRRNFVKSTFSHFCHMHFVNFLYLGYFKHPL